MSVYKCIITREEKLPHDPVFDDEEVFDVEIPVTVHYTFHGFCAGSTDGRYGPKIEPDEPAHIEIDGYSRDDGLPIELTKRERDLIEVEIREILYERSLP